MSVHVEATYGATKKFIAAGLESFNRQHITRSPPKSFALTAREGGKARGGLMAEGIGEWIVVSLLWVEDGFRRRGHGSSLLRKAEAEAKDRGAKGILVDTFSFQAPAFYKKHGYSAYGQVDDFPEAGTIWYRFKKAL
jgi:GNAT superfamily N-acetyltransferase